MRFLALPFRHAFSKIGGRLRGMFAETPLLFFVVVIGVALVFRVGIGLLKAASPAPEADVPVFADGSGTTTAPSSTSSAPAIAPANDRAGSAAPTSTGTAGAATSAAQPRAVPLRPRAHGRRIPHGG